MTVKKRMFMCFFLLWSVFVLGIGSSYAKYQSRTEETFSLKIKKPGTFLVTGKDEEPFGMWQTQSDDKCRLDFSVRNQATFKGEAHNSDLYYTLKFACTGEEESLLLGVFDETGNEIIYEGNKETWNQESEYYQNMGPGNLWRFYDQNGEELKFFLKGGSVSANDYAIYKNKSHSPKLMEILIEETTYVNQVCQQTVFLGSNLLPESNCLSHDGNIVLLKDWNEETDEGKVSEFEISLYQENGVLPGKIEWHSEQSEYFDFEIEEKESANVEEKNYIVTLTPNAEQLKSVKEEINAKIVIQWIPEGETNQEQILWTEVRIKLVPEVQEEEKTEEEIPEDIQTPGDTQTPEDTQTPGDTQTPEDVQTPDDTEIPEGTPIPEDSQTPENTTTDESTDKSAMNELITPESTEQVLQPIIVSTSMESTTEEEVTEETTEAEDISVNILNGNVSKHMPTLIRFELSEAITKLELETENEFPAYTKYSYDGGKRYYILAQGGKITLEPSKIAEKTLCIDFSESQELWLNNETKIVINALGFHEEELSVSKEIELALQKESQNLFQWKEEGNLPIVGNEKVLQYTLIKNNLGDSDVLYNFYLEQRMESEYEKIGPEDGPKLEIADSNKEINLKISSREGKALAGEYRLVLETKCQSVTLDRVDVPFFVNYRESTQEALQ